MLPSTGLQDLREGPSICGYEECEILREGLSGSEKNGKGRSGDIRGKDKIRRLLSWPW
ncbi:hypothetical protein COLO4_37480 [Corchorus olitorius]|uniref:Uncharacterized protein n=1 Tax=Corchorus olitorius TaxID=93759 RepID=A0A1R3G1D8_9ROSI|nr:hypothetical protein COLO4_37480 [Corchorus olitorius]